MRIDGGSEQIKPPQIQAERSRPESGGGHATANATALPAWDVKSIQSLMQLFARTSEVREEVVDHVKAKIQTGKYLEKQAAYDAASAILDL